MKYQKSIFLWALHWLSIFLTTVASFASPELSMNCDEALNAAKPAYFDSSRPLKTNIGRASKVHIRLISEAVKYFGIPFEMRNVISEDPLIVWLRRRPIASIPLFLIQPQPSSEHWLTKTAIDLKSEYDLDLYIDPAQPETGGGYVFESLGRVGIVLSPLSLREPQIETLQHELIHARNLLHLKKEGIGAESQITLISRPGHIRIMMYSTYVRTDEIEAFLESARVFYTENSKDSTYSGDFYLSQSKRTRGEFESHLSTLLSQLENSSIRWAALGDKHVILRSPYASRVSIAFLIPTKWSDKKIKHELIRQVRSRLVQISAIDYKGTALLRAPDVNKQNVF